MLDDTDAGGIVARHRCPERPGRRVLEDTDGILSEGKLSDGQNPGNFFWRFLVRYRLDRDKLVIPGKCIMVQTQDLVGST